MDESSQSHMQRFMDRCTKNKEAAASRKATRFAVDDNGNMIFDEDKDKDGCVTKTKKSFVQKTKYFKVEDQYPFFTEESTNYFKVGDQIIIPTFIEESNPEKDNRTVLYSKVDISNSSLLDIHRLFSCAGQIRSIMITTDEIQKKLSAEIEFCCLKSVAVAVAMAVKNDFNNVCTKTECIHVDSFPLEELKISEGGDMSIVNVFDQMIHIGLSHIPMTVDWLKKIFEVFGVVQKIYIPRPHKYSHLGYAMLQFESKESVQVALRLDKQLKFSNENVEVMMEVSTLDGTRWEQDGTLYTPCVDPMEDDDSM